MLPTRCATVAPKAVRTVDYTGDRVDDVALFMGDGGCSYAAAAVTCRSTARRSRRRRAARSRSTSRWPTSTRRIGLQITALERGIEPDLIGQRIADLRDAKETAEIELRALTPAAVNSGPDEDPAALLARIPNLAHALQQARPEVKRQVFDAFGLQVTYDKTMRRIEISATITEAIAEALHIAEDLPEEVSRSLKGT